MEGPILIQWLFILRTFQFVLAGMLWAVIGAQLLRKQWQYLSLWLSLSLISISGLGLALLNLVALAHSAPLPAGTVPVLLESFLGLASVFLVTYFLNLRLNRWTVAGLLVLTGIAVYHGIQGTCPTILYATVILILAASLLAPRITRHRHAGPIRGVLAGFLIALAAGLGSSVFHRPDLLAVQCLVLLLSLMILALHLDLKLATLLPRFFIRFNVIFILLAAVLMILVSQVQRQHILNMLLNKSQTPAETLRGYLLYLRAQGLPPRKVLDHPTVIRSLITTFSYLPETQRIDLQLDGQSVHYLMKPDGTIDRTANQDLWAGRQLAELPLAGRVTLVGNTIRLDWPILDASRPVGHLSFAQDPSILNRTVSRQLLLIFGAFTAAVLLAGGLIGVVLLDTQRLIREQYQAISETREQLVHATRLAFLGELASAIAHEINNPAGVISSRSGFVQKRIRELLEQKNRSDPEWDECLEDLAVIQKQALRIGRFAQDLLDLARPRPPRRESVYLRSLLQHCIDIMAESFRRQRIQVHMEGALDTVLMGDAMRLEQVFMNLMKNALDAMPEGGSLRLRAVRVDDRIRIEFHDTGAGIAPDILERIWEPFFTTKANGTGLGMSVARRIIEAHGGTITASSRTGEGTTFRIELPLTPQKEGA